jgi:hypothetical protein
MKDKILENKIEWLGESMHRIEKKLEPEVKISENVQHSLIWGIVLVIIVFIICWTIRHS